MPEYLAPGVYIEEVPSGSKPIEGVSTSTTGMVGVTARGPVNEPTLVTSLADFTRQFGGYLDHRIFTNGRDLLPYAAEGFFTNGGQRLYVTRVVGSSAQFAQVDLYGVPRTNAAKARLVNRAAAGVEPLVIDDGTHMNEGDIFLLEDGSRSEYVTAESDPLNQSIRLYGRLHHDHSATDTVTVQTVTAGASQIVTGDMEAGGTIMVVNANPNALKGVILRIQDTKDNKLTEYVTTDASGEMVESGLLFDHPRSTTEVHIVTMANVAGSSTTLDGSADETDSIIKLANMDSFADGNVVCIRPAASSSGTTEYQVIRNVISSLSILTPGTRYIHAAGTKVIKQVPLLRIHALHQGQWGNSLRVRTEPVSTLKTAVDGAYAVGDSPVKLEAIFGLDTGSVLAMTNGGTTTYQRVASIDVAENKVDFAGGVTVSLSDNDDIVSTEFNLIVELLNEAGKVAAGEMFAGLSMDPNHHRYAPKIVGAFDRSAGEPEETGESELIRISDLTKEDSGADRTGASALRLCIPDDGVESFLVDGDDDLAHLDDNAYIGEPADDPDDRTGIYALENIDDISIVAVPGRTSQDVQNAVIEHCTLMRYRFAVLDAAAGSKLKDVQKQRQLYDTTYAAFYYPWLVISDRFGRNGDVLHIPPSGHVAGIYARSDVQRGVHKAPANEVMLGIRDLEVRLSKGEQDILNPKHINCLRSFREINRGVRIWGARTLSSDPEWKYVNVRRLFLFVEKSIERGTQFAVFEPNSEPLWATVRRSVTNFLTGVWRDGALEGLTPEEAFFVKVDSTTMTQNDIDNGRLIILIGIAPVKPAEFVIFRISQKTREATG